MLLVQIFWFTFLLPKGGVARTVQGLCITCGPNRFSSGAFWRLTFWQFFKDFIQGVLSGCLSNRSSWTLRTVQQRLQVLCPKCFCQEKLLCRDFLFTS